MADQSEQWPRQGPASYFPSIEKRYGRSIADWQKVIADSGLDKHMAIVGYLKSEFGMGHGHANALVGWTLAGNIAPRESMSRRRVVSITAWGIGFTTWARSAHEPLPPRPINGAIEVPRSTGG